MNAILTNPTSRELIAATEANYIAYFAGFARLSRCTFVQDAEFIWFVVGDQPGNTVLRTNLEPERASRRIAEQLEIITSIEQARYGWWQVLPGCSPANLGQLLLEQGLTRAAGRPVMTLDLSILPAEVTIPDEIRLERVQNEKMLEDWLLASAAGFEVDVAQAQIYFDAYALDLRTSGQFLHYVGYLHDQPVVSSTLLLAGGLAGLYDVSTAPQARKQGLGRMISLAPLLDARRLGYRYAVLQATDDGLPLYEKLGFAELYREENYVWRRDQAIKKAFPVPSPV